MSEEQKIPDQKPAAKNKNSEEANENSPVQENFPDQKEVPPQTQIQHMDIHAQHLHKAPGQGWKHYLFEFLMLFLAVFCGFLAENQREKLVEHRNEARYMQNLLQDLARDTFHLQSQLVFQKRATKYADSLVYIMNSPDRNKYLPDAYFYARVLAIINPFLYSNATITQLKSSGSLRLIRKEYIQDSIVQYDVWTQRILANDGNIQNLIRDFRNAVGAVFDAYLIGKMSNNLSIGNNGSGAFVERPRQAIPLITEDKKVINQLCTDADFLASMYFSHFNSLTAQKARAIRLIELLKKEYHL